MCLGRDSEADHFDAANQPPPVAGCRHLILLRNFITARGINIADTGELRTTFAGERCMNARMLFAQVPNANDCSPKHRRNQRSEVGDQRSEITVSRVFRGEDLKSNI
jgi:hypothetical protein